MCKCVMQRQAKQQKWWQAWQWLSQTQYEKKKLEPRCQAACRAGGKGRRQKELKYCAPYEICQLDELKGKNSWSNSWCGRGFEVWPYSTTSLKTIRWKSQMYGGKVTAKRQNKNVTPPLKMTAMETSGKIINANILGFWSCWFFLHSIRKHKCRVQTKEGRPLERFKL